VTIEIFKAGTFQSSDGTTHTFSAADVSAIAAAYDPSVHEAPIVVGHPKTDSPAYGWVESLAVNKDGKLEASPAQLEPQFAELVKQGRLKKVSASFYAPDAPNNPKPGAYYLRHVGFLGANPPAVHGLRTPSFAAGEQGVIEFNAFTHQTNASLWRRMREFLLEKFTPEDADRVLPSYDIDFLANESAREVEQQSLTPSENYAEGTKPTTQGATVTIDFAAQKAELEQKNSDLKKKADELEARERDLKAGEEKQRRAGIVEFTEALVKEGKLLPRDRAGVVELMASFSTGAELEFAEENANAATKQPALDWLKKFLGGLPKQVDFSERAPAGDVPSDNAEVIALQARNYQADQAAKGIEVRTSDAVRHVTTKR
jgi:hypothetical protein